MQIDGAGGLPTFRDGPHDQRLTATKIAGSKDVFDGCLVVVICRDVATNIHFDAELFDETIADGTCETHGKKHKVGIEFVFAAGNRFKFWWRSDSYGVQFLHIAVFVAAEFDCVDRPIAHTALFVRAFDAEL